MIKILVSIVNYNSYDDTSKVIKSISSDIDTNMYEVNFIIVDNSSDTTSLERFMRDINSIDEFRYIDDIELLSKDANYVCKSPNNGFGAANNIVLNFIAEHLSHDAVWILNNDLSLDYNVLSSLLPYFHDDKYPILGSVIDEGETSFLGTVNMDGFKGYAVPNNKTIKNKIYLVDAVAGTSMFIKSKFINELRFDEDFFMYLEENDLCYRFKNKNIYSYMVKDSKVYHEGGKTFGNNQTVRWYYKVRNLLHFKRKNGAATFFLMLYLLVVTLKNYHFALSYFKAYIYAVYDFKVKKLGFTKREF